MTRDYSSFQDWPPFVHSILQFFQIMLNETSGCCCVALRRVLRVSAFSALTVGTC